MSEVRPVPLLIVGGGIGGMAAALAVASAGHGVHLLERAPEFAEIGAGLQVGPNAVRVLRRMGLTQVERHAVAPDFGTLMDAVTGRHITSIDLRERFRRRYGAPYLVVHRNDVLQSLLDACRSHPMVSMETGKHVVEVVNGEADARVVCADGSEYLAGVVVGADGLWSTTRRVVVDDEPVCSRSVAYRGTLPVDAETEGIDPRRVVVWIGPDVHLVQYRIRGGDVCNQVAVFRSRCCSPDSDDWGNPEELEDRFSGMCDEVRAALPLIDTSRRWQMYDREPISTWTRGRTTLLGDAAHPMLQYLGQGACQALEDAECLGAAMREFGHDPDAALAAYQAERIDRTARAQRASRNWGDIWHLDGIAAAVRNRLLSLRAFDDYSETDWLYQPVHSDGTAT